jgi:circadian clock protein KaiC
MSDTDARLATGTTRLDDVLGGGLPQNAINLIMGLPGTGKTILAQQLVFHNARPDQPALYLSTVSEPFDKILHYGQSLSFFKLDLVGESVYYDELGSVLEEQGLAGTLEKIKKLIFQYKPSILVIDSFKALHSYASSSKEIRTFMHNLAGILTAYPVSTFWVGEYNRDEIGIQPEFAIADSIIELAISSRDRHSSRMLEILKLRGSAFASGKHAYRISESGLDVFPRLADPAGTGQERRQMLVSSGIAAVDAMLADGYRTGTSTLVTGPTGVGKTIMGLHFLFYGANHGERVLFAGFQEDPSQLEHIVARFGWSLSNPNVTLFYRSPIDLYIDEWIYDLLETVEATGVRRVFIDSLNDLEAAAEDATRYREYMYSLVRRLFRKDASLMMSYEVLDLFSISQLTYRTVSHIADNIVLLRYRMNPASVGRDLTVLKTRGSTHSPEVEEFQITPEGIHLVNQSRQ